MFVYKCNIYLPLSLIQMISGDWISYWHIDTGPEHKGHSEFYKSFFNMFLLYFQGTRAILYGKLLYKRGHDMDVWMQDQNTQ